MKEYIIRPLKKSEIGLLEDFLYEAVFQKDEENLIPRSVIKEPTVSVYIDGFGKKDDYCLVAVVGEKIVGAVWSRILAGSVKGFGNIDEHTPELAISLYKTYRGLGIGTALMHEILSLLKQKGYARVSLSVQKENYAAKLYEKVGFKIISENDEDYIMVHHLQ